MSPALRPALTLLATLALAAARLGAAVPEPLADAARKTYAEFLSAAYDDSLAATEDAAKATEAFLAQPSEETLRAARAAWTAARGPYLLTEIGRFYGGPVDDERNLENQLNPWPIDAAFIETAPGSPSPGLVQDVAHRPRLDPATLASVNALEGEKNIACGWHAWEFMLWGVDRHADGPGSRPFTDFTDDPFAPRRKEFLRSVVTLLLRDLRTLSAAWKPGKTGNYRAAFEAQPPLEALGHLISPLYQLPGFEMASERIGIPLMTRVQEDETDCFSDTTHLDFAWNLRAVTAVWRGEWTRRDGTKLTGTGVRTALAAASAEGVALIDEKLPALEKVAPHLPGPFDRVITQPDEHPDRQAWETFRTDLEAFADLLAHVAKAQGLEIQFENIDE